MLLDSLACILVSILYKIDKNIIKDILNNFKGAIRRFNETRIDNTIIIDDYAHHPTEIKVTFESAKQKYPNKKIIGVFLPNTYSRTKDFMDDFSNVLSMFDKSFVFDIKCDREKQSDYPNVSSDILINKTYNCQKICEDKLDLLLDYKDNVICFMSCANITPIIEKYKDLLEK